MKIQCDKCKKIYDSNNNTKISFCGQIIGKDWEHHICPDCSEKLREWITKPEADKN